jgi:hypothetical protein
VGFLGRWFISVIVIYKGTVGTDISYGLQYVTALDHTIRHENLAVDVKKHKIG